MKAYTNSHGEVEIGNSGLFRLRNSFGQGDQSKSFRDFRMFERSFMMLRSVSAGQRFRAHIGHAAIRLQISLPKQIQSTSQGEDLPEEQSLLNLNYIQADELYAFIGKKEANLLPEDRNNGHHVGETWIFLATDAETKLVPTFAVGPRNTSTAEILMTDLASRLANRPQLTTERGQKLLNQAADPLCSP